MNDMDEQAPLGKSDIDRIAGEIRAKAEALLAAQEGREIPGLSHGRTIEDLANWAGVSGDARGNVIEILHDLESVILQLARDVMFYVSLQEVNSEIAHKLLKVFMIAKDISTDGSSPDCGPTTRNLYMLKRAVFSPQDAPPRDSEIIIPSAGDVVSLPPPPTGKRGARA